MKPNKNILWLSLAENVADNGFVDFFNFAGEMGVAIRPIQLAPPMSESQFAELLAQADGFLLTFEDVITHEPYKSLLLSEIKNGKRLVVLGPNQTLNHFLVEFDLAITSDRLCGPAAMFGDERTVLVNPGDQANATALALLDGTDLTVSSPYRVWYGPLAKPLFAMPADSCLLSKQDYFEDPGVRELCCGGLWVAEDTRAAVLVLAGSALRDSFQGVTGKVFPGIRANPRFAGRLIEWLSGSMTLNMATGTCSEQVHSIEVGLYDLVVALLQDHYGDDWWERGLPENVKEKALKISVDSRGVIPKAEGFYFITYKKIMAANWQLFAPHFADADHSKSQALHWLDELNDVRNRLSHPLRLRGKPITLAESEMICSRKNFVENLCRKLLSKQNVSK